MHRSDVPWVHCWNDLKYNFSAKEPLRVLKILLYKFNKIAHTETKVFVPRTRLLGLTFGHIVGYCIETTSLIINKVVLKKQFST